MCPNTRALVLGDQYRARILEWVLKKKDVFTLVLNGHRAWVTSLNATLGHVLN